MPNTRVIARLDIKGPNLVKGIHLEGLRILGKPEDFARCYYEEGADELIYMDIVASLYGRNSLLDIVKKASREIFIPLTVGGGLRSIDDIRAVLIAGADKVSINTEATKRPEFISEAAQRFGSSTIVVSIEAKKKPDGNYEIYTDNGREMTGLDALEWAKFAAHSGAGELLVTSIDQEGTGKGFDCELASKISSSVEIPVILSGGAGSLQHIIEVIKNGNADAVALASVLHYKVVSSFQEKESFEIDHLKMNRGFSRVAQLSLSDIKLHLSNEGINVRPNCGVLV